MSPRARFQRRWSLASIACTLACVSLMLLTAYGHDTHQFRLALTAAGCTAVTFFGAFICLIVASDPPY